MYSTCDYASRIEICWSKMEEERSKKEKRSEENKQIQDESVSTEKKLKADGSEQTLLPNLESTDAEPVTSQAIMLFPASIVWKSLVERIRSSQPWYCQGHIDTLPVIKLNSNLLRYPLDPSELRMFSKPAPFGKGDETVYDETIRKAWQIQPNQLTFDYSWIETISKLQAEISIALGTSFDVRFEFYKIMGYDQDGHFDWHRDTLRGPDHFATFLVSLPVLGSHQDGTLEVCEPGVMPSSEHAGTRLGWTGQSTNELQASWCCFHTDCYHKLHPVTRGSRVVLAYNVFKGNDVKKIGGKTSLVRSSVDLSAQMQEVISQALAQREEVCIQLLHQYPEISDPRFLKGSDRLMYEILRQAFPPRQIPISFSVEKSDEGDDEGSDVNGNREKVVGVRTEEQFCFDSFEFSIQTTDYRLDLEFYVPYKLVKKDPIVLEITPDSLLMETIKERNLQSHEIMMIGKEEEDEKEDDEIEDADRYYNYETDCPVKYFKRSQVAFLFDFKDACLNGLVSEDEGSHHTGNEPAPRILSYRPIYLRISSSSKTRNK